MPLLVFGYHPNQDLHQTYRNLIWRVLALTMPLTQCKFNKVRGFRCIDFQVCIGYLEAVDFSYITPVLFAKEAASLFVEQLSTAVRLNWKTCHTPNKKSMFKPWLTPGLLCCIRTDRDKHNKKFKNDPVNTTLNITYKLYRNFCNALLRKLMRNFERSLLIGAKTMSTKSIISYRNP